MSSLPIWQFRLSRALGRLISRIAAFLTLGRMPPFVSTSALVVRGDSLLVVADSVRHEPVLPGGHLKWDEDPRDAVVREVREETGYVIRPDDLLGVFSGVDWAGERGVVRVIYTAELVGGEMLSSAEGEAGWAPVAEVAASTSRDAKLVRLWLAQQMEARHAPR